MTETKQRPGHPAWAVFFRAGRVPWLSGSSAQPRLCIARAVDTQPWLTSEAAVNHATPCCVYPPPMPDRRYAASAATLGAAARILQFILILAPRLNTPTGWLIALGRFLGYFSIQMNILVVIAFACIATGSRGPVARLLARPAAAAGITVWMLLVALGYELLLRALIKPQGLNWVADLLLHIIMPVLYVAHWWVWCPKKGLEWKHAAYWCLVPLAFLGVIIVRALAGGGYTYPFLNVSKLGFPPVVGYVVCLLAGTWVLGVVVVAAARWKGRT